MKRECIDRNLISKGSVFILFAVIGVVFFVFYYLTPLQNDDNTFTARWLSLTDNLKDGFLRGYIKYFIFMRYADNTRLSNLLFPVLCIYSPIKDLFPFIATGCVLLTIWLIRRLSFCRPITPYTLILSWAAVVVFLPWRMHMFEDDFALNYVFGGTISLLAIFLLVKNEKRGWSPSSFVITSIVCALAGAWHEGFAVPTLFGIGMLTLVRKFRMSKWWYFTSLIYFIVALVMGLSPAMINRFEWETNSDFHNDLFKMVADLSLVVGVILLMCGFATTEKGRSKLLQYFKDEVFVICLSGMILGTYISVTVHHTGQTAYYPELLAIICTFKLLGEWLLSWKVWIKISISIIITCALGYHAVNAINWCYKFYQQDLEIRSALKESGNGTVFYDIIYPWDVPIKTLYFPSRIAYCFSINIRQMRNVTGNPKFSVVPTGLKLADISKAHPLGCGVYDYNGFLLCNFPETDSMECTVDYEFEDGTIITDAYGLEEAFETLNGNKLVYLLIFNPEKKKIKRILNIQNHEL